MTTTMATGYMFRHNHIQTAIAEAKDCECIVLVASMENNYYYVPTHTDDYKARTDFIESIYDETGLIVSPSIIETMAV